MNKKEARKLVNEMTPDVLKYIFCLAKSYEELEEEIERLNNIINELETYMVNEKERMLGEIGTHVNIEIDNILDKLQELKENK